MPKAKLHWAYDLLAIAVVGGISAIVFWLAPPDTPPKATAALAAPALFSRCERA